MGEQKLTTASIYADDLAWLKARQLKASGPDTGWIAMPDLVHAMIEYVRETEGEGA